MNAAQHNDMVRSFVADIGVQVKAFGVSRGYNLSNEFYNDLMVDFYLKVNATPLHN